MHPVKIKSWGITVLLLAAALLILFAPLPFPAGVSAERHFRIEASQYRFSPEEITVNPGDRVTIALTSTDVVHGLSLDGYDFQLTAEPGQTAVGSFVASKGGVFRFRCSVACGNLHPFMIGKLRVGPNLLLYRAILLVFLAVITGIGSLRNPGLEIRQTTLQGGM
jgi:heme/copper-type cytochrome/quinol oxidase subunit 2